MQSSSFCLCCHCLLLVLSFQAGSATSCSDGVCPSTSSLLQRTQFRDRLEPDSSQSHEPESRSFDAQQSLSHVPPKVLRRLVLPAEKTPCELLFPGDARFLYTGSGKGTMYLCGFDQEEANLTKLGLHPSHMHNAGRWQNSLRLLGPVGSLPCCPTPPHCMAPTCRLSNPYSLIADASLTCTKSPPKSFYSYLTLPDVWPAYFARGGSSDLDVVKHWDVLGRLFGCYDNSTGQCLHTEPFDLSIDLGADWGSYTERFVTRKFAKDFIMVDCSPQNKGTSKARLTPSYLSKWYSKGRVPSGPSREAYPQFEFLSYALSNESGGTFDICDPSKPWGVKGKGGKPVPPCPVPIETVDAIVPGKLSPAFQSKFEKAQSLYIKMDVDGMDQLTTDGMRRLLREKRGTYADGTPRHLVNFMMMEFCPSCIIDTRKEKGFTEYDLGTQVKLFESLGFELFLIGPHYIPLSHGSWSEAYNALFSTPEKCPSTVSKERFMESACLSKPCGKVDDCMFAADLFAMRASHPHAKEIKLALGSCSESTEFDLNDAQYTLPAED